MPSGLLLCLWVIQVPLLALASVSFAVEIIDKIKRISSVDFIEVNLHLLIIKLHDEEKIAKMN